MLEGLNKEQQLAVNAVNGPVIVFAGAGSGKTTTLTQRIDHMINDLNISPYNILAITYTNKATREMKERLGQKAYGATISTIHSFCALILRREISVLGYTQGFNICDEEDQLKVIQEVLKENGGEKNAAKNLLKTFNYYKCFMSRPTGVLEEEYFDLYNDKLKELNMLDFEDLLLKTYEIFSNYPEILEKYQDKYKYILVDEFQDTDLVQYKIVRLLALKNRNIFIVGDDDQSIYSFRGTNYENFKSFKEDFPEYETYTLSTNYRSTDTILEYASRLISHNTNRQEKNLVAVKKGSKNDVELFTALDEDDEARFVARTIESMKKECEYKDFAVLYRSSVLLRNVEIELMRRGLPYKVYGGLSYLKRKEVKDVLAYLRLILNDNDIISFKRIVNIPSRGIGLATIDKVEKVRKEYHLTLFETIDFMKTILPTSKYQVLVEFRELIKKYQVLINQDEDLVDLYNMFLEDIGYEQYLYSEFDDSEASDRMDNVNDFASVLYKVDTIEIDKTRLEKLKQVLDDSVLSEDYKRDHKEDSNGITVSTIHSVKGLEYKTVFVIGLEEELFPKVSYIDTQEDLEEERRICYVAFTRAKDKLFVSHARRRLLFGRYFNNEPSRFIKEAFGITNIDQPIIEEKKEEVKTPCKCTYNRDASMDGEYNISDKVYHESFGEGTILSIDRGIGTIFFASQKGTKKILLNHPKLSKITK